MAPRISGPMPLPMPLPMPPSPTVALSARDLRSLRAAGRASSAARAAGRSPSSRTRSIRSPRSSWPAARSGDEADQSRPRRAPCSAARQPATITAMRATGRRGRLAPQTRALRRRPPGPPAAGRERTTGARAAGGGPPAGPAGGAAPGGRRHRSPRLGGRGRRAERLGGGCAASRSRCVRDGRRCGRPAGRRLRRRGRRVRRGGSCDGFAAPLGLRGLLGSVGSGMAPPLVGTSVGDRTCAWHGKWLRVRAPGRGDYRGAVAAISSPRLPSRLRRLPGRPRAARRPARPARSMADDVRGRTDDELATCCAAARTWPAPHPPTCRPWPRGRAPGPASSAPSTPSTWPTSRCSRPPCADHLAASTPPRWAPSSGSRPPRSSPCSTTSGRWPCCGAAPRACGWPAPSARSSPTPPGSGPRAADSFVDGARSRRRRRRCSTEAPPAARAILDRLDLGTARWPSCPPGTPDRRGRRARAGCSSTTSSFAPVGRPARAAPRGGAGPARRPQPRRARPRPADPRGPAAPAAEVDAAAGQQVTDLLALVDELAAEWGLRPPRVLRSGGLAVRDLKRLALGPRRGRGPGGLRRRAHVCRGPPRATTARSTRRGRRPPRTTSGSSSPGDQRWAVLARAWLLTTRAPHLVGTTPAGASGTVNALGPDAHWPPARGLRRDVLDQLAAATGRAGARPRQRGRRRCAGAARAGSRPASTPSSPPCCGEAEWLGVTGRGAISSAGRALLDGPSRRRAGRGHAAAPARARRARAAPGRPHRHRARPAGRRAGHLHATGRRRRVARRRHGLPVQPGLGAPRASTPAGPSTRSSAR